MFSKAKAIAAGARADQREAYGESRDRQARTNLVRRAAERFEQENQYEPQLLELVDYINDVVKPAKPITKRQVRDVLFAQDEKPAGDALQGVQCTARERGQDRIIDEAGFNEFTPEILNQSQTSEIDNIVEEAFDKQPFMSDTDIKNNISKALPASALAKSFRFLKETYDLPGNSWSDLSNKDKRSVRGKVVNGLFREAENRLGKQTTPSQELDFDIEAGDATFTTDTRGKSKQQINSHRRPWSQTAKELNNVIDQTDFDNDWVQWSPGQLGNIERGRAKGIPDHVLRELNKQPARVAKLAAKNGLEVRKDTKNPGVYHIYKPGGRGSKPDFQLTEGKASTTKADPKFLKDVTDRLQKAWPGHRIETSPKAWNDKISELRLQGVSMPWHRVKGFVVGNGVYLSPTKVGYDTPIHEFAHVWERQLQRENPKLWKRGVELLKGSEYARAVYNIPKYKSYLKDRPNKFWGEVMANAIGKRGAVLFDDKSKQSSWDKWMDKVGNWIKNKLGILSDKDYADLTLNDWLDVAVQGTFTGTTPQTPSQAIEYSISESVQQPKKKAKILREIQKNAAEKAAKQSGKKDSVGKRISDWFVGPSADDYHGLADRFSRKNPKSDYVNKFKALTKKYSDQYHEYEKAATDVREQFKDAGDRLAKDLKIEKKGLDNYLAQDSDIKIGGIPISYNQALALYSDKTAELPAGLRKQLEGLPQELKDFVDNLPFKVKADKGIQQSMLTTINKDLLKSELDDFLNYKRSTFLMNKFKPWSSSGEGYADALQDSLDRMSGKTGRGTEGTTASGRTGYRGQ